MCISAHSHDWIIWFKGHLENVTSDGGLYVSKKESVLYHNNIRLQYSCSRYLERKTLPLDTLYLHSTQVVNQVKIRIGENLRLHSLGCCEVALRHGLSQWSVRQVSQFLPAVPCIHMHCMVVISLPISSWSSVSSVGAQWVAWPLHWHLMTENLRIKKNMYIFNAYSMHKI